jgi:hypothetical protein
MRGGHHILLHFVRAVFHSFQMFVDELRPDRHGRNAYYLNSFADPRLNEGPIVIRPKLRVSCYLKSPDLDLGYLPKTFAMEGRLHGYRSEAEIYAVNCMSRSGLGWIEALFCFSGLLLSQPIYDPRSVPAPQPAQQNQESKQALQEWTPVPGVAMLSAMAASGLTQFDVQTMDAAGKPDANNSVGSQAESGKTVANREVEERARRSGPQSVTADELERILAKSRGGHDAAVARQLAGYELKERLSNSRLQALVKSAPGPKSRLTLLVLADVSVFLAPAATDETIQAPPDVDQQRHMIALTVDYLGKTLQKLPNFYAKRTTVRYEGDIQKVSRMGVEAQAASVWRRMGSSEVTVLYRDGKEIVDPREWEKRSAHPEIGGLITKGTFGPILSAVIVDASHGEMTWDRWERGNAGTLAVFRYTVPESQSHYSVSAGFAEQAGGYHGDVAIDPATGAILRLTVKADPLVGSSTVRADIMVEYGPVDIGGKTYTCPMRSVSISRGATKMLFDGTGSSVPSEMATMLNDANFSDYHIFRSESRILTMDGPALNH